MARAGGYGKVSFASLQEEKKPAPKRVARRRNAAPIFSKYVDMLEDPFWKKVFENLALGRFPKGFSFYEGSLVFKKGTKSVSAPVLLKGEEEELADPSSLLEFLRKHGNLISPSEIEEVEKSLKQLEAKSCEYGWKDFSKNDKIQKLFHFAAKLSKAKSLDHQGYQQLLSVLLIGFNFKYFGSDNIKLSNMEIENIDSLAYNSAAGQYAFQDPSKARRARKKPEPSSGGKQSSKAEVKEAKPAKKPKFNLIS